MSHMPPAPSQGMTLGSAAVRFGGPDRRRYLEAVRGFHGRELAVLGAPLPALECRWPVHGEDMDFNTREQYVAKHCQTKGGGGGAGPEAGEGAGPGGGPRGAGRDDAGAGPRGGAGAGAGPGNGGPRRMPQ